MPKEDLGRLKALGQSNDVIKAVDQLGAALDSKDDETRQVTVDALRELLRREDFPTLFTDEVTPTRTRQNILKALRYLKEPKYIPMVAVGLRDEEPTIRTEAALVLSVYGAAEAEYALIAALNDRVKEVRYHAANALSNCHTDRARRAVLDRQRRELDPTVLFALQKAEQKHSSGR